MVIKDNKVKEQKPIEQELNIYPVKMILYQLTSDTNIEILRSWFPEECLEKLKKWVFF